MEKFNKGFYFIPLGGTGEFGASLNLYCVDGEFIVVDMGVSFDKDVSEGVLIPDPAFLMQVKSQVKGIVLTHAHEDHYGSIPYIAPSVNVPVYGSKFSIAMLNDKMKEFNSNKMKYVVFENEPVKIGNNFEIQPVRVIHSIPDSYSFVIKTKYGSILHTGDWRFGKDLSTGYEFTVEDFKSYFKDDVPLSVVCDSTGVLDNDQAEISEKIVRENLLQVISNVKKERVVVSCFSSNITRLETLALIAKQTNRKLIISGRSLKRSDKLARECAILKNLAEFEDEAHVMDMPRDKVLLVCTGSQGETNSAMFKIANGIHNYIKLEVGDYVIFSAKSIPGNEKEIMSMQNTLVGNGINIISNKDLGIHSSGHQSRADLVDLYNVLKPEAVIPVHGDFMHVYAHRTLAYDAGVQHVPIVRNGECLDIVSNEIVAKVKSEKMSVDGVKIIPINGKIIAERRQVMRDGFINIILKKFFNSNDKKPVSADGEEYNINTENINVKINANIQKNVQQKNNNRTLQVAAIQFVGLFESSEYAEREKIRKDLTNAINKKVNAFTKDKPRDQFITTVVQRNFSKLRGKTPYVQSIIV